MSLRNHLLANVFLAYAVYNPFVDVAKLQEEVSQQNTHLRSLQDEACVAVSQTTRDLISDIFPFDNTRKIYAWDLVPLQLRAGELVRQLKTYHEEITNAQLWEQMNERDWDLIHAPARIAAFTRMVEYWHDRYSVSTHDRESRIERITAILIGESFFDHRAVHKTDLGISQISAPLRSTFQQWYKKRRFGIDFQFEDYHYMNPYNGIRAGTFYFLYILEHEAKGKLDLATMAYNTGIADANKHTRKARQYLAFIQNREERYVKGLDPEMSLAITIKLARSLQYKRELPVVSETMAVEVTQPLRPNPADPL